MIAEMHHGSHLPECFVGVIMKSKFPHLLRQRKQIGKSNSVELIDFPKHRTSHFGTAPPPYQAQLESFVRPLGRPVRRSKLDRWL